MSLCTIFIIHYHCNDFYKQSFKTIAYFREKDNLDKILTVFKAEDCSSEPEDNRKSTARSQSPPTTTVAEESRLRTQLHNGRFVETAAIPHVTFVLLCD